MPLVRPRGCLAYLAATASLATLAIYGLRGPLVSVGHGGSQKVLPPFQSPLDQDTRSPGGSQQRVLKEFNQRRKQEYEEEEEEERMPDFKNRVDRKCLFFNRVPKTGSENFVWVLKVLSEKNGFVHRRYGAPEPRKISERDQRMQAKKLTSFPARPMSYDRHVYFFDFAKYGMVNPFWFSMVREPIAKFESRYYYSRFNGKSMYMRLKARKASWVKGVSHSQYKAKDIDKCVQDEDDEECNFVHGHKYDLTIPYFCGQADECQVLGSQWALEEAKRNIEKWYPVVGVLERLEDTLALLEDRLPTFFEGVTDLYQQKLKGTKKNHGIKYRKVSDKSRSILTEKLALEIEFYEYVRDRLRGQVDELRRRHQNESLPTVN